MVTPCLTFEGLSACFSKWLHCCAPGSCGWEFWFLHVLANDCHYLTFDSSHPSECEVVSHGGLDLQFPDGLWCWASFHMFNGHLYIFFGEMPFQILCLIYFLILGVVGVLYILYMFLIRYMICKYFQGVVFLLSW